MSEVLRAYAESFLTAGGTISMGDWADMDQPTRDAFEAAGLAVEAVRLSRLATALGHYDAAARLLRPKDGGVAESFASILSQMEEVTGGGNQ